VEVIFFKKQQLYTNFFPVATKTKTEQIIGKKKLKVPISVSVQD
jgi:hypothetical protein